MNSESAPKAQVESSPYIKPKSQDANEYIELVFRRLGIHFDTLANDHPLVIHSSSNHVGMVGSIVITWSRGYWCANGNVSIELARRIYAADTRKNIRCSGHCGAPSPDDYGCEWFDVERRTIVVDPDGTQLRQFQSIPLLKGVDISKYRFVKALDDVPDRIGIVDSYHIDTEAGLGLFVAMVRYDQPVVTS